MRSLISPKIACAAIGLLTMATTLSYAALPVDVSHQAPSYLQAMIKQNGLASAINPASQLKIINSDVDFNHTTHVRMKQTYRNVNVWGAEVMMHVPAIAHFNAAMLQNAHMQLPAQTASNGVVYEKLENDLGAPPADKAAGINLANKVIAAYIKTRNVNASVTNLNVQTLVYVNPRTNKATWAYLITCTLNNKQGFNAEPNMIVDASSGEVYQQWDQIENSDTETSVSLGGEGGNPNAKFLYGMSSDYPAFTVDRILSYDPFSKDFRGNCYVHNDEVKVTYEEMGTEDYPAKIEYTFPCHDTDPTHNNLYWDEDYMSYNGGYSPVNDALYGIRLIRQFYNDWYGLPVYTEEDHKTPKQILVQFYKGDLTIASSLDVNAGWDSQGQFLFLGRGGFGYYPFTSAGVIAHELSHAFTNQHSDLTYSGGSGAMNESFSDMATQAIQVYLTGKNDWRVGKEIIADPVEVGCADTSDCALRYMDTPTKDGKSLDNVVTAMYQDANVHYSSGVFNKMFYLLATQPKWNVQMAFNVMVQANQFYWIAGGGTAKDYKAIACGIISATKDYQVKDAKYDVASVVASLKGVGFKDDGLPVDYPYYDYDLKDCE